MEIEIQESLNKSEISSLNNEIYKNQINFLESDIGKVVNSAVDIGLKAILPNLIEDEIIDIKNAIISQGFKEGVKSAIDSALDMGKSMSGIVTGNFENISQVQMAIKKGGILDKISEVLDLSISMANKKNLINNSTATLIKQGKNTLIGAISDKIEETLSNQIKGIEKLEKHCINWEKAYKIKDINQMEKAYKNINKYLNQTVPLENILKQARKIENLHNIIKNNENNFEITPETILLAEKFN